MTIGTLVRSDPTDQPGLTRGQSVARLGIVVALLLLLGFAASWGVVAFVIALIVSIVLHELGHYLGARWGGMKVTEYFIGFGPRIWSTRRGETEYGLKALPLGAYVKVPGMSNLEEIPPEEEARTYRAQSLRPSGAHGLRRSGHEPADRTGPLHRLLRLPRRADHQRPRAGRPSTRRARGHRPRSPGSRPVTGSCG